MCSLASAPRLNSASKNAWKAITRQGLQVLQTLNLSSFGMNTYRLPARALKTNDFNPRIFRTCGKMHSKPPTMNTYKKTGGWGERPGHTETRILKFPLLLTINSRLSTASLQTIFNAGVTLPLARMSASGLTHADHPSRSAGAGCTYSPRQNRGAGCTCSPPRTKDRTA